MSSDLDVFDKTVQTTDIWLKEINEEIGPDKQLAWQALGVVLRAVRDRVPAEEAAHLAAELPLLVRGTYYEQYRPVEQPKKSRSKEEFLEQVAEGLDQKRPVNPETATRAVLHTVSRQLPQGQVEKTRNKLPEDIRELWQ